MKRGLLLGGFLLLNIFGFSQNTEEVTKKVEVFETVEESKRNVSIGVFGGPIKYLGEYTSETEIGFGVVIEKHYNAKFNMQYNLFKGAIGYTDSSDREQLTDYFGFDAMASVNLVELIANKDNVGRVSPYLSLGLGLINSKAEHYIGRGQLDLSIPGAVGANFFITNKFSLGVDLNARYLFSDNLDNSLTSSVNDIILSPGITLKFLVSEKTESKRVSRMETVTYYKPIEEEKTYEKYVEPDSSDISYEPFVEINVKEDAPEDLTPEISNWTLPGSNKNQTSTTDNSGDVVDSKNETTPESVMEIKSSEFLFYTVQVGSYKVKNYDIKSVAGIQNDYIFFNKSLNLYNYLYGVYGSVKEAESMAAQLREKIPGAFVVALYKDKRYIKRDAIQLIQKNPSIINVEASKSEFE